MEWQTPVALSLGKKIYIGLSLFKTVILQNPFFLPALKFMIFFKAQTDSVKKPAMIGFSGTFSPFNLYPLRNNVWCSSWKMLAQPFKNMLQL